MITFTFKSRTKVFSCQKKKKQDFFFSISQFYIPNKSPCLKNVTYGGKGSLVRILVETIYYIITKVFSCKKKITYKNYKIITVMLMKYEKYVLKQSI